MSELKYYIYLAYDISEEFKEYIKKLKERE